MENKKVKKQLIYKIIIIIFVFLLVIGIVKTLDYKNSIELCQLKDNGTSQMMGYIITTKNNNTIVIDGGTQDDTENFVDQIKNKTGKVNYWFITHPHKDHASTLIDIVKNTDIEIDHIYVTLNDIEWYKENDPNRFEEINDFFDILKNDKISQKVEEVELNQNIMIDNIRCQILGIKNPEIVTNATNNSSMVIKMQVNNKNIIFLGDSGKESSEKLLKIQSNEKLRADIIQVAHHGQNGGTEELYKIINPTICLWPTPEWLWNNDSGNGEDSGPWKTKETRKWIESLKVKQNIIEKDGNKTIRIW